MLPKKKKLENFLCVENNPNREVATIFKSTYLSHTMNQITEMKFLPVH